LNSVGSSDNNIKRKQQRRELIA